MNRTLVVALALVSLASGAGAQAPAMQQKVAEFKQMLAANQQARRAFTWLETTQIAYQGVVKTTKLSDCQFSGPSPKPTCTELSLQQAPLTGGFIRRKIEEKKGAELKAEMDSVRTLVMDYVPLNSEMIEKSYQAGNVLVSEDPVAGTRKLLITSYQQKGDTVTIIWNTATKKLNWVKLSTYLVKPSAPVQATVQFANLPNGVFYAYRKSVSVPASGVVVTVTSSDFAESVKP
jgi:hypothetical protein